MIRKLRQLAAIWKARPCIRLSRSGQLTNRPQVHLSLCGQNGAMSVFTELDTSQGNATIELHGKSMSHLTGLPLIDQRGAH